MAESVSEGIGAEYHTTAGGRVRFVTDSPYVAIKVMIPHETKFSHMSLVGIAGFDMYVFEDGRDRLRKSFLPPFPIPTTASRCARAPWARDATTIWSPWQRSTVWWVAGMCS